MNTKIVISNLYKSFGEKKILNNVNIEIKAGEILAILGGSGSGKSVFLKILIGLLSQDKGEIYCDKIEISKGKERKNFYKKCAVLFQNNALFDSMNIRENILFPFINSNISKEELEILCDQSLKSVGLDSDIKELALSEISGGMQKRVALARCIITKPEIIFLDEPTSGLDVMNSKIVFELIQSLSKQYNITVLVITHDIFLAPLIANRILFLERGHFSQMTKQEIDDKFEIHTVCSQEK